MKCANAPLFLFDDMAAPQHCEKEGTPREPPHAQRGRLELPTPAPTNKDPGCTATAPNVKFMSGAAAPTNESACLAVQPPT